MKSEIHEKILISISSLKTYIKTDDVDAKSQSNKLSIIKLASEAQLNLDPECKSSLPKAAVSSGQFINRPSKNKGKILRRKIKPRIIDFDDEDIGYEVNSSPYLYLKKIKRLAEVSLEIEFSPRMIFKEELVRFGEIYINKELPLAKLEEQIAKKEFELFASEEEKKIRLHDEEAKYQARQHDIEESITNTKNFREYLRNSQKKISKAKKISKLLDPVVFFIQEQIEQCKEKASNNNKHSLGIKLPSFKAMEDDFLTAFLRTIDYEKFKELINFSESILFSINEINKTLNKIDVFSKSLGISLDYINSLDNLRKKIIENFSRDRIINFLEASLNLFKQRTLTLDNNYCLLEIKDKKEPIEFLEPNFLSCFISKNNLMQISKLNYDYLDLFFNQNQDTILFNRRCLEKKDNLFKILLNFFLGEYYFLSRNCKDKFVKQFFLNIQEHPDFDSIKSKMFELKWWHFILFGISPFYVFKKGFRECLSEKLFLHLLKKEFKNCDKEPSIKYIDDLYSIRKRLNNSNIFPKSQSISLSLIDFPQSRDEIIQRLNNHEKIKDMLNKISILANCSIWCVNEFSKVLNTCQQASKKTLPCFDTSKEYFFKNVVISRSFILNDNASHFSSSYVCRSIN